MLRGHWAWPTPDVRTQFGERNEKLGGETISSQFPLWIADTTRPTGALGSVEDEMAKAVRDGESLIADGKSSSVQEDSSLRRHRDELVDAGLEFASCDDEIRETALDDLSRGERRLDLVTSTSEVCSDLDQGR